MRSTLAPARRTRPIEHGHYFTIPEQNVPGIGKRQARIYLPPGYERDVAKSYPVFYMFDGQNVFDDEGSFAGGWRMHRVLDRLAVRGLRVPVVVALNHGGADRVDELTPWPAGGGRGGKADALLDWICGDLHAQVRRNLRVVGDPAHTLVGGSSMGGLTALYALFRRPETFGAALAMSPSLWVDHGHIFRWLPAVATPWSCRVYLDAGGRERWLHRAANELTHLLVRKGLEPGRHLMWRYDPRGRHHEPSWRRRLPGALRFLLKGL